jgi:hypothetical protein
MAGGSTASFTTSSLSSGAHDIVAIYSGDSVYGNSMGSITQTIDQSNLPSTTTSLNSTTPSSVFGQAVTFTATVSGGNATPTGSVVFEDGTTVIGTSSLSLVGGSYQASLTTSTLVWGMHAITAVYLGDGNNAGSSGATSLDVLQGGTITTLASSANPVAYGQSVTLTATVTPTVGTGTPTGSVTFINLTDGSVVGTASLSGSNGSAQATLTTSTLDFGDQQIIAVYNGDFNFYGSSSDSLNQWIS